MLCLEVFDCDVCEVSIQKVDIEKIKIIPLKYETPEKKIKGNKRKSENGGVTKPSRGLLSAILNKQPENTEQEWDHYHQ